MSVPRPTATARSTPRACNSGSRCVPTIARIVGRDRDHRRQDGEHRVLAGMQTDGSRLRLRRIDAPAARQRKQMDRQARARSGSPHRSRQASRQPNRCASQALSGQHTVLAKPPNSVTDVIAAARVRSVDVSERRERRVVEPGAHAGADDGPGHEIQRIVRRETEAGEAGGEQQRAARQHGTAAMAGNEAADARRHDAGDQQADRGARDHPVVAPAGIARDCRREHGQQIERRAPGQNLRDAERGDEDAAIGKWCRSRGFPFWPDQTANRPLARPRQSSSRTIGRS